MHSNETAKLQNAFQLYQAGNLPAAELLLRQILATQNNNYAACYLLGLIESRKGNKAQAKDLIKKSLNITPPNADYFETYATLLYQTGQFQEAEEICARGMALDAKRAAFVYLRAISLLNLQKMPDSLQMFDKLLVLQPDNFIAMNERGVVLAQMGRFEEALQGFQSAINTKPDYAEGISNYANALQELDRFPEALACYDNAIALKPDHAESHFNRAHILQKLNNYEQALASYNTTIKYAPNFAEAYSNRGNVLQSLERFEDAITDYVKAISLEPRNPENYSNLGNALLKLERTDEALANQNKAISLEPRYAEAHSNRGNVFLKLEKFADAVANYNEAIALNPNYAEAYSNRAMALHGLEDYETAVENCNLAIQINPNFAEAYSNRANALTELKRFELAQADYDKAIALNPNFVDAYINRGNLSQELSHYELALTDYAKALALEPNNYDAFLNRGNALRDLNKPQESLASYKKAAALKPNDKKAHVNLYMLMLLLGDFENGWKEAEWRYATGHEPNFAGPNSVHWLGTQDLRNKTILVRWEQGFGDVIQFSRYLIPLVQMGARVLFMPQRKILGLMRGLPSEITLVDEMQPLPASDYHCHLMSLPLALKTTAQTIPATTPYLQAEQARVDKWKAEIGDAGFKIGICWQGSTTKIDKGRSFKLAQFHNISLMPNVRLISLHKGEGVAQLDDVKTTMKVEVLGADFDAGDQAFLDTAAVMKSLDLVITSDTAVAHLAGALGVPTWVALKHVPDWRWQMDRTDSPWYPNMKLFRQPKPGDWKTVFTQIQTDLEALIAAPKDI